MELTPLLIYGVIQAAVFLTPVLIIGHRQGKKDQVMIHLQEENKKLKTEIDSIEMKVDKLYPIREEQLSSLTNKISKIEVDIGKIMITLEFLKGKERP